MTLRPGASLAFSLFEAFHEGRYVKPRIFFPRDGPMIAIPIALNPLDCFANEFWIVPGKVAVEVAIERGDSLLNSIQNFNDIFPAS
jgi:hypothetical protein